MARAKYIHCQPAGQHMHYIAVYDANTLDDELLTVAMTLGELPGVKVLVAPATLNGYVKVVLVEVASDVDATSIVAKMKELTKPVLQYTIATLALQPLVCTCRYTSTQASIAFVSGLEPDDQKAFNLRYAAAVQKLPVAALFEQVAVDGNFDVLLDVFCNALNDLGAHVVCGDCQSPIPDPRPCTHSQ